MELGWSSNVNMSMPSSLYGCPRAEVRSYMCVVGAQRQSHLSLSLSLKKPVSPPPTLAAAAGGPGESARLFFCGELGFRERSEVLPRTSSWAEVCGSLRHRRGGKSAPGFKDARRI